MLGLVGIVAKRLKQFVADEEGRGVKADRESDFQAATTAESPLMQRRHLIPRGGGGSMSSRALPVAQKHCSTMKGEPPACN